MDGTAIPIRPMPDPVPAIRQAKAAASSDAVGDGGGKHQRGNGRQEPDQRQERHDVHRAGDKVTDFLNKHYPKSYELASGRNQHRNSVSRNAKEHETRCLKNA
ncbi:hypothetical protein AA12717_2537 [Gluconacetobacter sacchari DSM 12717]|uniref:Uncharacterized protein n=1 Tax=Gluconacetobacter sacchari DSM 12717 TaxID=1307940 RepID=A0ABQ0P8V6_9PROT|nr:hypothetical protein AA12717_2537 [Gluconacetobacter sacchari DSM 12717]